MGFETILNGVWLALGVLALLIMLNRPTRGRSPLLCFIGVGLIVTTMFPVISASDDVIRIEHLENTHGSPRNSSDSSRRKRTNDNLIRLYEAMESPLAATPVTISFTLFFAFLIAPLCDADGRQRTIASGGRSPPVCLA